MLDCTKTYRLRPATGRELFELEPENGTTVTVTRIDGHTYLLEECDGLRPCDCSICVEHRLP